MLFAYSVPSILTRIVVPLVRFPDISLRIGGGGPPGSSALSREVNYALRLTVCAAASFAGLQLLALVDAIGMRVVGIMLCALSSNLGDMSLQMLCARYPNGSKHAFGGYTAGSGTAAILGASLYTLATSRLGMAPERAIAAVGIAPLGALAVYALVLPEPDGAAAGHAHDEKEGIVQLPWQDKLRIIRPMFVPYMLPLASIFFIENTVSQVRAPAPGATCAP